MAYPMGRKGTPKYQGSLNNFGQNEDGRALLIPGKQNSVDDSSDADGYQYHLTKINRFDLPEGFLHMGGLRGYIFMTRPDLNLLDNENPSGLRPNDPTISMAGLREMLVNGTAFDKENLSMLQQNTGFPSPFMPVFTNFCKGFQTEDQRLESIEVGETHHRMKIKYAKHAMQSRSTGSFTLNLQDSKFLPVYKALAVWTDYIEMVFMGDLSPKDYYIKESILDYAVSLYYLVTKADGIELVYWNKLVGVYPQLRPDSAFSTAKDQYTFVEYSVPFEYSLRSKSSVLDPVVLSELNTLAGWAKKSRNEAVMEYIDSTNTYYPNYDRENDRHGVPFVNSPMIEFINGKFLLRWI